MNAQSVTAEELLEVEREKCKTDLYYLCRYVLGYKDMRPQPHKVVDKFIHREQRKRYLHIELPRSTFKSTEVTVGYSIQRMINDPAVRILIDNETFSNAKTYLTSIRMQLKNNRKLLELFPFLKLRDDITGGDTDSSLIIVGNPTFAGVKSLDDDSVINKEPNVSCAGVDKTRTGQHYDIIIMDDLVSERNVTTPEQIEKVKTHFKLCFSLLDPPAPHIYRELVVIGTRFHYNDLYSMLLSDEYKDLFDTIIMPAVLSDGSLCFPDRITRDYLEEQRRIQGTYIFNCQYMLNPVDEDKSDFKKKWVRYWRGDIFHVQDSEGRNVHYLYIREIYIEGEGWKILDKPRREKVTIVMTYDPASKKRKKSDHNAIWVTAVTRNNNWFVLDIVYDKMNPKERVDIIFELRKQWKIDVYAIEEVGFQETIRFYAQEKMAEINDFFSIKALSPRARHKEDRIRGLVPRFENGCIYLPVSLVKKNWEGNAIDVVKAFLDQYIFFPLAKTGDDLLDGLCYLMDVVKPSTSGKESKGRRKTGRSAIIS
jgi:predicted phage terminase large subunit-like protein